MTVRFQTGFSVVYNDANYVSRQSGFSDLYTNKEGRWIAQVPNTAIIETVKACRFENPDKKLTIESALELLVGHVREIDSYYLREKLALLKTQLQPFNARTKTWRP